MTSPRFLDGACVVVTRAPHQAGALASAFEELGARCLLLPMTTVEGAADGGADLLQALASPRDYEWIVFTSVNAVEAVSRHLEHSPSPLTNRIAAVGPVTSVALQSKGFDVQLTSNEQTAASLVAALPRGAGRVLVPQASDATDAVAVGLSAKGWEVTVVEAYRKKLFDPGREALAAIDTGAIVTFMSSSALRQFHAVGALRHDLKVAVLGPGIAETARTLGVSVDAMAPRHDMESLVAAVLELHQQVN